MRIGMRLLLGYFLIVAIAAWFVLSIFVQEVKPGVRRATEGTLIDTATLLAEIGRDDLLSGHAQQGKLAQAFSQLHQRPFRANIGGIHKVRNEYHVYMTDAQGRVVFDSAGLAVGQDYSRWNDVWLTLRGEYGARSTQSHPDDPESTVMYVAAPVVDQGKIIGVLSVGKPNSAMAPVIHRSERRILWAGGALLGIALLIGLVVAWWINRSIGTLSRYADSVTTDTPLPLPNPGSSELHKLAQALENMRIRLEGKNYIERYVHALTHELKSPMPLYAARQKFSPSSRRRRWLLVSSIIFWYKTRECSRWLKNCSLRLGLKIGSRLRPRPSGSTRCLPGLPTRDRRSWRQKRLR